MKYVDKVIFVKNHGTHYDPDSGSEVSDGCDEVQLMANVSSPSISKSSLVFGDLKTTDVIVHLKQPFKNTYDYCLIDNRKYFFVTEKIVNRTQIIVLRSG